MLRLDKNDPLDRMILQELNSEPILFDTWLDAMDELAEEPDCVQVLQECGRCAEDVLSEAKHYQADFRARVSAQELPLDNRFALCAALFSKTKENPSQELLRIYCEVLSDPGFLLESKPAPDDDGNKEQNALQYAAFSCFPNGCEDNVVLMDSNLTPKELDQLRQSEETPILRALDKVSDYMNARTVDLAVQMAHAAPEEVKALCQDILEQSRIKYRPKSPHETELFLAAINSGLMDCQDWLASYLLTQAGHALLGEPTEIPEWTE